MSTISCVIIVIAVSPASSLQNAVVLPHTAVNEPFSTNDTFSATDGIEDYVNCGTGIDTAHVDEKDNVDPAQATSCENRFTAK